MPFLKNLFRIEDALTTEPRGYLVRRGDGRAVIAGVSGDGTSPIQPIFTRRIDRDDVVNGKLISASSDGVKRRGGKRVTSITLSYEGAEALYRALSLR